MVKAGVIEVGKLYVDRWREKDEEGNDKIIQRYIFVTDKDESDFPDDVSVFCYSISDPELYFWEYQDVAIDEWYDVNE